MADYGASWPFDQAWEVDRSRESIGTTGDRPMRRSTDRWAAITVRNTGQGTVVQCEPRNRHGTFRTARDHRRRTPCPPCSADARHGGDRRHTHQVPRPDTVRGPPSRRSILLCTPGAWRTPATPHDNVGQLVAYTTGPGNRRVAASMRSKAVRPGSQRVMSPTPMSMPSIPTLVPIRRHRTTPTASPIGASNAESTSTTPGGALLCDLLHQIDSSIDR